MPGKLARDNEITRPEHFETTNGAFHDPKFLGGPYGNIDPSVRLYKKAPGHWKVEYTKNFHDKVLQNIHTINVFMF